MLYSDDEEEEMSRNREREEALEAIFFKNMLGDRFGRSWIKRLLRVSKAFSTAENSFPTNSPQLPLILAYDAGIRYVGGEIYETLKYHAPQELAELLTEEDNE